MRSEDHDDQQNGRCIYHRSIEPDTETANVDLVGVIAELEGCDAEELPPFWSRVDGLVGDVFSAPPEPEAQVRLQFSYAGYRVGVDQSGDVELMKVVDVPSTDL